MANNLILVISFGFKLNSNLNFDHPSLVGQLQARWVCCSPWNVQFLLLSLSHHALSLLFPPFLPSAYGMLPSLSNLPSPITGGRGGGGLRIHVRCSSSSMGTPQLFASFSSSGDSCVMSDNQEAMNDRAPLIAPPVHATKVSKTLLPLLCVLLNAPPHPLYNYLWHLGLYNALCLFHRNLTVNASGARTMIRSNSLYILNLQIARIKNTDRLLISQIKDY